MSCVGIYILYYCRRDLCIIYIYGYIFLVKLVANNSKSSNVHCKGFLIVAKYNNKLMNIVDAGFLEPGPGANYKLSNCYPPNVSGLLNCLRINIVIDKY